MLDRLKRPIHDLRVSVTDRCNFRCNYCMPRSVFNAQHKFLQRRELLSFEEITRMARLLSALGVRKLRLTGGEPLLRRSIEKLIAQLSALAAIDDLSMTTNGVLLSAEMAEKIKAAGIQRLNLSLDSLDEKTFALITDTAVPVGRVLAGIQAARDVGLPVKINMVVKRGCNEKDILPMVHYCREHDLTLRFIEYMDVGSTNGWRLEQVVPAAEIVERINRVLPVEPVAPSYRGEVARRWRYQDGHGEIGMIASVTQPFCGDCSRLRLSAEGRLYTCLFAGQGHDARMQLRGGLSDEQISAWLKLVWRQRRDRYSETRSQAATETSTIAPLRKIEMSYIGG